jgi:fused signal recognition particle receptor
MFKSLKNKLKSWITRTKEETEEEVKEEVVTTPKEKKKPALKKQKEKSKPEKKSKPKEEPTKKEEKKPTPKEDPKEEPKEEIIEEPKKEKTVSEPKLESPPKPTKEPQTPTKEPTPEPKPKTPESKIPKAEIPKEEPTPKEEKEKTGFFKSFFGKKTQKEEETKESEPEVKSEPKKTKETKTHNAEPTPKPTSEPEPDSPPKANQSKPESTKEPTPELKPKKTSFFRKALTEEKFNDLFDELELILLQNNVAYAAIENIRKSLKEKIVGESAKTDIEQALKESIEELLINPPNLIEQIKEKGERPFVILFAGINGAGKTTTIAKIANLVKKNDLTVCLASADTFRAAAIEQLQVHADRLKIPLIKKDYGSDPASVGFDAIKYAKKNNIDVVLIDTAGRMNNRDTLMKEIEKIARVNSPDLKIFLGESITGNDATEQAKDFNDAISIDGIVLSKADVDEKGGTAISVAQVTNKPIYFLGTGQSYDDLETFNKEKLIERIFS